MKAGQDISASFHGLFVVHHNKPGQQTNTHSHGEHHLIIPLRGEFRLRSDGKDHVIGPGKMIYLPAKMEHEFLASGSKEGERLICFISPKLWKSCKAGAFLLSEIPVSQVCKELLFYLLLNPKTSSAKALAHTVVLLIHEALELGLRLGRESSVAHILAKARDIRVKKAVSFLEDNFTRDDLKIAEVAKCSGLSPRNLNRLFVEELGLGPKEILIRLRLEEAKRMLKNDQLSVTEVSLRVGYNSLSRFIQAFRSLFGHLPSEKQLV